jgi:hypothetical protein
MLSRLRLGPKLLLAPLLVLVLMFIVSCIAYGAIARQGDALEDIVQQRAAQTRSAAELAASARQAHAEVYQLITWISASFSQARTDTLVRGIHRRHAAIERSFTALTRLTATVQAEGTLVRQADGAWRTYLASVLDVIELARNDQSISANAMTRSERAFDTVLLRLDALTRHERLLGERAAARAADDSRTIATLMPAALMAALALALLVTMAVRRAMLDALDGVVATACAMGDGDLRALPAVDGRDEICQAHRMLGVARRNLNVRLHDALDMSHTALVFALDEAAVLPQPVRCERQRKGMPGLSRPGHPYLRLAASRR